VDENTPELAISLFKEYRNLGIGTRLMKQMIDFLQEKGYQQTSLSVQKANYAVSLYKKLGYEIVDENDEDYIMVLKLN
jgi:ribosomal protein S18 acetylase RimI-like enzyme